jgi:SpoVK/Ycf46/Vps4 family AAA+-type ATPase
LTSPPLTVEELSENAQTNISSFKFDDPTLDAETKEKMYDEAEEKLRSLMKEWRAINRNLRKIEKDLMSKKARKSRNNENLLYH